MTTIRLLAIITLLFMASACQTSDTTLREGGHNNSYIVGFHDGRHTGMREQGNVFEHFIQDRERYESDQEYREGWLAGEAEGKKVQLQADMVGGAAAGAYSATKNSKKDHSHGAKDAMNKAVRNVDTSELEKLAK